MSIRLFWRARAWADSISSFPIKRRIRKAHPPRVIEPLEPRTLLSGPVNFAAAVNYPVGQGASSIVAADFNGDGKPDLAVTNADSDTVSVLLNLGDGRFGPRIDYGIGGPPSGIAAGDFNGDGKVDLAVAEVAFGSFAGAVSILLNRGDGTFAPKVDYPNTVAGRAIAVADFNHDGRPDIAIAGSRVGVMLNNGDGTFGSAVQYGNYAFFGYFTIIAADFTGDGLADIAVVSNLFIPEYYAQGTITILGNNGDGLFGSVTAFANRPPGDSSTGYAANSIAAADFNGDGRIDVAENSVGYQVGSEQTMVFLNRGLFAAAGPGQPSIGGSMAAADFNGDGKVDLAVCQSHGDVLTVALNKGNGEFLPPSQFSIPYADLRSPNPIVVADFNGDGRPDLAVVSLDVVSVLLNSPNRPPTGVSISSTATPAGQGAGTVVGTFTTEDPDAAVPFSYSLVKGEGSSGNVYFQIAGNMLKTAAPLDVGNYSIRVRSTDAGGLFRDEQLVISVIPPIFAPYVRYALNQSGLGGVTAGDFNGDGKPDLAVAFPQQDVVGIMFNKGDGTFALDVDYATGRGPGDMAAADFNGDGRIDLAVANYSDNTISVLLNAGDGTFAPHVDYATGRGPGRMAAADLNGDGKIDLAVANYTDSTITVLLNVGDGTFLPRMDHAAGTAPKFLVVADINGDGRPDLAVADFGREVEVNNNNVVTNVVVEAGVAVLLNKGDGTFGPKTDYVAPIHPSGLVSADFNSDGKLDLAWWGSTGDSLFAPNGVVAVLLNKGDGTFGPEADFPVPLNTPTMVVADFNGDGHPDLALGGQKGYFHYIVIMLNNGHGALSTKATYDLGYTYVFNMRPADFNGDGNIDVNVGGYPGPLLLGNGDGTFSVVLNLGSPPTTVVADFNGDGNPDLAGAVMYLNLLDVALTRLVPRALSADVFAARRWAALESSASAPVNFGILRARRKGTTRIFRIANAGSKPLAIGKIIVPKGFKLLHDLPRTLAVGQSAVFKLQFIGLARGQYTGTVRFATSDPLRPKFVIPLYARRLPRA